MRILGKTFSFLKKHPLLAMVLVCLSSIVILIICTVNFFLGDLCSNEIRAEVQSPDGALKAVVFNRDCGATTGFSTQISILNAGDRLPNDGGNVFIMDADHNPDVSLDVDVVWLDKRKCEVVYDPRARIFRRDQHFDVPRFPLWVPVQVKYRERMLMQ